MRRLSPGLALPLLALLAGAGAAQTDADAEDDADGAEDSPYVLQMQRLGYGQRIGALWRDVLTSEQELGLARDEYEALRREADRSYVRLGPLTIQTGPGMDARGQARLGGALAALTDASEQHERLAADYWGELAHAYPRAVVYGQFEESYATAIMEDLGDVASADAGTPGWDDTSLVSSTAIYSAAASQPFSLRSSFVTPLPDHPDALAYLQFDTETIIPPQAELRIAASGEDTVLVYKDDDIANLSGVVGPLVGDRVDVELYYPPGADKQGFLVPDDLLRNAEILLPVELEEIGATGSPETGAEAAWPWCGADDSRTMASSEEFPFVGRLSIDRTGPLCTAFVLSDGVVVTAGHCFADITRVNSARRRSPKDYTTVYLEFAVPHSSVVGRPAIAAMQHRFRVAGEVECRSCEDRVFEPGEWPNAKKTRLGADWAVFSVTPLDQQNGSLDAYGTARGYAFSADVESSSGTGLQDQSAVVAGFGRSGGADLRRNFSLQRASSAVTFLSAADSPTNQPVLTYGAHTEKGSSGGPIMIGEGGGLRVIGVHTHGFCQMGDEDDNTPINAGMPFWGEFLTEIMARQE